MSNTFLAVEGPQDSEFIAKLLKKLGFQKVAMLRELEGEFFCKRLLNRTYPIDGDLNARMPTPMYMRRNNDWIAIRSAGGETPKLLSALDIALQSLKPQPSAIDSIGVIRDADNKSAEECFSGFIKDFQAIKNIEGFNIQLPPSPGIIAEGSPRFGTFIFPDNNTSGALETLLEECGHVVYPGLMQGARSYVKGVDVEKLDGKDLELFNKPLGRKKATLACVADILKPGMSIQVSIDQNRWICEMTEGLPRIAKLSAFLSDLVGGAQ
jgi:hypothetical protein